MSVLGELRLAASFSYSDEMASTIYLNQKIDFVDPGHVEYLRPINKSVGGWLKNSVYNQKLLERLVPFMDLVVGYMPSGDADTAMRIARRHEIPFLSFLVACPWDSLHNHHRLLARLMAPISFLTTRYSVRHSDYVHYVTKEFCSVGIRQKVELWVVRTLILVCLTLWHWRAVCGSYQAVRRRMRFG